LTNTSALPIVRKVLADGRVRFYVYAHRGGPLIHTQDRIKPRITPELLTKAERATGRIARDNLDKVIDLYRDSPEFTSKAPKTQEDYRQRLNQCSAEFGRVPLRLVPDLSPAIIRWRDSMADTPRAADRCVGMLHTVIRWGKRRGLIKGDNPAADLGKLHRANRADLIWEERHWEAVNATKPDGAPMVPGYVHRVLTLASLTGLRIGDLLSLRWEHVHEGYIALTTSKSRHRTEAIIPLHPDLARFFIGPPWRGEILRNSEGEPWKLEAWKSAWGRAKPEGFDRRGHDLRGTFATRLMIAGFTDGEIAMILGWETDRLAALRARYVDRGRVVRAMAARLSANQSANQIGAQTENGA
jgi:integrase